MSDRGAKLLDEVRQSLETEKYQIDALQSQVNSGSMLLKQKEEKLQQLEDLAKEVDPFPCVAVILFMSVFV